jgi:hypothetical protein
MKCGLHGGTEYVKSDSMQQDSLAGCAALGAPYIIRCCILHTHLHHSHFQKVPGALFLVLFCLYMATMHGHRGIRDADALSDVQ